MTALSDPALTQQRRLKLRSETALSRQYLRIIERWIPIGRGLFATWPDRPDCGHFLGGCHWYGIETLAGAIAFAAAASSPEYNPKVGGCSRQELRTIARQALRYLCFTHDSGPPDCVRPAQGLGRPENFGRKWGERGKGFFPESQCGTTVAGLAIVALLLGDAVDEATWAMIGRVHADYAERFGTMDPKNGVYLDTQMEENGWTSVGLASVACVLGNSPTAPAWAAAARRWMFSTAAAPQDAKNLQPLADGQTVAEWTGKTFTALPDFMAENHGMVHPNYTGASVHFTGVLGVILGAYGQKLPPQAYFNRAKIYAQLKLTTDRTGSLHPVQGMDWPYLFTDPGTMTHAAAAVMLRDSDAARFERMAVRTLAERQASHGGRMVDPAVAAVCHDVQDPMVIRECVIANPTWTYLLHRVQGDGPAPTPRPTLERKLRGVKVYPHSGFVFQRHPRGQTSFSWRNCQMALPLTTDGIQTVAPASHSWLGRVTVQDRPDSQEEVSVHIATAQHSFAAALVMDRAQGSVRQQVLYAGLPDGTALSCERLIAQENVVVSDVAQGFLRIINEHFSAMPDNCHGYRIVTTPGAATRFAGFVSPDPASDIVHTYAQPGWLNVDDRLGFVFRGTGETVYHNRHFFSTWWATADDLTLSRTPAARRLASGTTIASLSALILPGQTARQTARATLLELTAPADCVGLIAHGHLAAACFGSTPVMARLRARRDAFTRIPVFEGTARITNAHITYHLALPAGQAVLRSVLAQVAVTGEVEITASPTALVAHNNGRTPATITVGRRSTRLRPGQTVSLR
ncbi:MAG: hypothetical protein KA257_01420 [Opitutaceae bacterium]|nr:hypothetical protein [Opitutaceae bacterium]MBP9913525.1 hypothetical protein [Opitutaceae bacterium]